MAAARIHVWARKAAWNASCTYGWTARKEPAMHDVLVFYATTEGQTRRIAERIAADIAARGFNVRAIDVMTASPGLATGTAGQTATRSIGV
jgi:flavorubredoxin